MDNSFFFDMKILKTKSFLYPQLFINKYLIIIYIYFKNIYNNVNIKANETSYVEPY